MESPADEVAGSPVDEVTGSTAGEVAGTSAGDGEEEASDVVDESDPVEAIAQDAGEGAATAVAEVCERRRLTLGEDRVL